MGIGPGYRHKKVKELVESPYFKYVTKYVDLPNPDPSNYRMLEFITKGNYTIVKVQYPDCVNFEGIKIMVWEDKNLRTTLKKGKLDPHFSDCVGSCIARFEPTDKGMELAKMLLDHLAD